jgi:kynureninase
MTREEAVAADRSDPLRSLRDQFCFEDGEPIYLDGNSLGRQPAAAAEAVAEVLGQWRTRLVRGWDDWIDLPHRVGDRIGALLGAAPGQVVVSDSTTVNLYKLAAAALDERPDRRALVYDVHDFPTVRYVLEGIAERHGLVRRAVPAGPDGGIDAQALAEVLDEDVGLVCLSGVNYRSGAVLDLDAAARAAHDAGALVLWDLSHAVGAVPVELDRSGADLAVGCGYKYLNGGPGAPAWLYVRQELQDRLRQPIWGWWGQRDQFAMSERYQPAAGIDRFCAGTPAIVATAALGAGLVPLEQVGIPALWSKTRALVGLLGARVEAVLAPLGAHAAWPEEPSRRGGHLPLSHPRALRLSQLLIERGLVVGDFRPPDVLRLAPVAAYTRFVDVWDAVERVAEVLADAALRRDGPTPRVT